MILDVLDLNDKAPTFLDNTSTFTVSEGLYLCHYINHAINSCCCNA